MGLISDLKRALVESQTQRNSRAAIRTRAAVTNGAMATRQTIISIARVNLSSLSISIADQG